MSLSIKLKGFSDSPILISSARFASRQFKQLLLYLRVSRAFLGKKKFQCLFLVQSIKTLTSEWYVLMILLVLWNNLLQCIKTHSNGMSHHALDFLNQLCCIQHSSQLCKAQNQKCQQVTSTQLFSLLTHQNRLRLKSTNTHFLEVK